MEIREINERLHAFDNLVDAIMKAEKVFNIKADPEKLKPFLEEFMKLDLLEASIEQLNKTSEVLKKTKEWKGE